MIRIIGIGSPFGDDAAGLAAARQLVLTPPPNVEVVVADRPGPGLVDLLDRATAVILIDAAHSRAPPGTLHDLDLFAVSSVSCGLVSSHAFGAVDAIALAAALGLAPTRGRILAIAVTSTDRCGGANLSPAVRAGVARAIGRAREWAARFTAPREA